MLDYIPAVLIQKCNQCIKEPDCRILAGSLCFGEITHSIGRFNTESMRVYFPDLSRRRGDAENHKRMMYGSVFLLFPHPVENTVTDRNLQSVLFSGFYDILEGFWFSFLQLISEFITVDFHGHDMGNFLILKVLQYVYGIKFPIKSQTFNLQSKSVNDIDTLLDSVQIFRFLCPGDYCNGW